MLFYLQTNWGQILERWGWPTLVAIVLGLVFWKGVWPIFKKQLTEADAQRVTAQNILTTQLEKAERRIEKADQAHEKLVTRVTEALEEQNRFNRRMVEGMDEVLERTKHL
jgi:hypothetical protein